MRRKAYLFFSINLARDFLKEIDVVFADYLEQIECDRLVDGFTDVHISGALRAYCVFELNPQDVQISSRVEDETAYEVEIEYGEEGKSNKFIYCNHPQVQIGIEPEPEEQEI